MALLACAKTFDARLCMYFVETVAGCLQKALAHAQVRAGTSASRKFEPGPSFRGLRRRGHMPVKILSQSFLRGLLDSMDSQVCRLIMQELGKNGGSLAIRASPRHY